MKEELIVLRGAEEHNLRELDVYIPRNRLTVITGVSGSGKSSLAFDTLFREGQRRFLETLPSYARSFVGGLARPAFKSLEGIGPAVAVSQRASLSNPRSTVGTLTEVWDLLRLLFARLGTSSSVPHLTRGLFSFNAAAGACPTCQGLGIEDRLDPELLVADARKSLRQGALRVSLPNGYLMYSQVTIDVLDQILHAHGSSVDVPWQELSDEARQVVLHGSDRLKVPYGKHPLESRLKWTGITPRPRQEGFYRGLVPVMEGILRGKRNDSILRFVRSTPCSACAGARLRPEALSVQWRDQRIVDLATLTANQLAAFFRGVSARGAEEAVLSPIRTEILGRCTLMAELGVGYLTIDRGAPTLSLGEAQRLRLLGLAQGELRGLLVVLDEPSAGLHPGDVGKLLGVLRRLCEQGQTVVVVDHDPILARHADWLLDLGPGPAKQGGKLLWSGPPSAFLARKSAEPTPTWTWLTSQPVCKQPRNGRTPLRVANLSRHNVRSVEIDLRLNALNLIVGLSGSGKTSLLEAVVARLQNEDQTFARIVTVDASPIGRTPRSNAATYTGAFDLIRNLFAATADAKALGLAKGHFSFNTAGGRCEVCEGAGVVEVGMRYLGAVDLVCEACEGKRFHKEVLKARYCSKNIADVLESSIAESFEFFSDQAGLRRILGALVDLGLGYLSLGQAATTLSGGEAQRIKLATELAKSGSGAALVALDEPTTGLHAADVASMLESWDRMIEAGHTLLVAENDLQVIRAADQLIELGPGSGPEGGQVVFQGCAQELVRSSQTATAMALAREVDDDEIETLPTSTSLTGSPPMELLGVHTHNLTGFDVAIPARGLTAVIGPSGCGKSSLVFTTLLAEAQNRFADLVSPWARRLLPRRGGADLEVARNLQAAVAVPQSFGRRNPRSTVGTAADLDPLLRLFFSRFGARPCPQCGRWTGEKHCGCGQTVPQLWAGGFSPNTESGACPTCKGLGFVQQCDPAALVAFPDLPLDQGALAGSRFGAYLGECDGQHMAVMHAAALAQGLDLHPAWRHLGEQECSLALFGAGEKIFDVVWSYRRGKRKGEHRFQSPWKGLLALVEQEYERTHADAKGEALEGLLADRTCPQCSGERLSAIGREVKLAGKRFPEVAHTPVDGLLEWLNSLAANSAAQGFSPHFQKASVDLQRELTGRLQMLSDSGLGYLCPDREMASLSGGEAQRVRLAASLGGGLVGVTYMLDEPTRGLHARDTARLVTVLRGLADAGNAVVVVEHDAGVVAGANHIVEIGPGAGPNGGQLLGQGTIPSFGATSYTARLLNHHRERTIRPTAPFSAGVTVRGASQHNLKNFDVTLPRASLVCVTGVSGSGKSSLVMDVLAPSLTAKLRGGEPKGCRDLQLHADFCQVTTLDQRNDAAGSMSTVFSLIGISDLVRRRFAALPEAKTTKLSAKHFSTAAPGGRCEACEGRGAVVVAMDLLPDVTVGCETCLGRRFKAEILDCKLDGHTISDVLDASVTQAAQWFASDSSIAKPLRALADLGLGYLGVGQEAKSLSAGELQRLHLSLLLSQPSERPVALLLDEPTQGLGFEDVDRLIAAFRRLAATGHLVVIVEHDLDLIAAADWVIDLGPEAGDHGGEIVAQGTPAQVAAVERSHTGRALTQRGLLP